MTADHNTSRSNAASKAASVCIDPVDAKPLTGPVTPEAIDKAVDTIVTEWMFPDECIHTPDAEDMLRCEKYSAMLRERMVFLVSIGADPTGMTAKDLLPNVKPSDLDLTAADCEAY